MGAASATSASKALVDEVQGKNNISLIIARAVKRWKSVLTMHSENIIYKRTFNIVVLVLEINMKIYSKRFERRNGD